MKLKAVNISGDKFVGVTTLADIRGHCPNPRVISIAAEKGKAMDRTTSNAVERRAVNQRKWDAARIKRAALYARYIKAVTGKEVLGDFPPVTLWTDQPTKYEDGCVIIDGATIITASDGETQLGARYDLAEEDGKWLDVPFAFTLAMNSTREAAMQTLHDFNYYATPVKEQDTMTLNVEGALTKAMNHGKYRLGSHTVLIKPRGDKVTGDFSTTEVLLMIGALGALYGKDAFSGSISSKLKKANAQFASLNGGAERVAEFVNQVLRLPHASLVRMTADQMLAAGALFAASGKVASPLQGDVYKALITATKAENDGKRLKVERMALEVSNKLAA